MQRFTEKQLEIIGKFANIEDDKKLVYLQSMLDYMEIAKVDNEQEFITELYNYVAEHGTAYGIIADFCNGWNNPKKDAPNNRIPRNAEKLRVTMFINTNAHKAGTTFFAYKDESGWHATGEDGKRYFLFVDMLRNGAICYAEPIE